MQTPRGLVLRTLVILSILVAVPLFALFGAPTLDAKRQFSVAERRVGADVPDDRLPRDTGGIYSDIPNQLRAPVSSRALRGADRPQDPLDIDIVPTGYSEPPPPDLRSTVPPRAAAGPRRQIDRFRYIQKRLHKLGAQYFRLETLGGEKGYHFFCQITLRRQPSKDVHFAASDEDPLRAMGIVLAEVEQWYEGQH